MTWTSKSGFTPRTSKSLTPRTSFSSIRGSRGLDESRDYVGAFKAACIRKYRTLIRAWRLLLDPEGVGRVPFTPFCAAARSVGFGDVKRLWAGLDSNQSGFFTMDEWDPVVSRTLTDFRKLCYHNYGSMDCAYSMGMDANKSKKVTFNELQRFCYNLEYDGDVTVLFKALDLQQRGFISPFEVDFLARWQGERYNPDVSRQARPPDQLAESTMLSTQEAHEHFLRPGGPIRWVNY